MIARSKVGTYPLQIIIESIKGVDESLIIIDAFKKDILDICFVILFLLIIISFIYFYIIYLYNIFNVVGFTRSACD